MLPQGFMKKMILLLSCLILFPLISVNAFEYLYKDNKGQFHYRCNEAGLVDYLIVTFRENGILINSKKHGLSLKRNKLAKHINNAHVMAKAFCNENPGVQPMVIEQ